MAPMVIRHAARRVARAAHRLTAAAAPDAAPTGVRALSVLATAGLRGATAAPSLLQRGALMPATSLPMFLSARAASTFTAAYNQQVAERAAEGIVAKPLDAKQVSELVELMKNPPKGEEASLKELLSTRVPPGVDDAAYVKASFLSAIVDGSVTCPLLTKVEAVQLLGTMQGGYNIGTLVQALDNPELADEAAKQLSHTLLMFDAFYDVEAKAKAGNAAAKRVMDSWAAAEWFTSKPAVPEKMSVTVFKVTGETNTDDLSPAPDAWSRPDIPLHALAMLKIPREGITDAPKQIEELKKKGLPLAYVGDVVGTGSSRKSATNSILWYMGDDIPFVPNKRTGGVCIGTKIAPIFFNTMEDSGSLPIEMPAENLAMGDMIDIYPYEGVTKRHGTDEVVCNFELKTQVLLDEVRAGGRIPLIVGRGLTDKVRPLYEKTKGLA